MIKDWTGNSKTAFSILGASNHSEGERETNDFYATDPKAVELLLKHETFSHDIWEPACGGGHISEALKAHGHNVKSTDLIDRGYGTGGIDFLSQGTLFTDKRIWGGDIVTNPPYKFATEFVIKALDSVSTGHKVAMFLKIQFLEGTTRYKELFSKYQPKTIYVSVARSNCAKNADFKNSPSSAVCYCWYIWEKGYTGEPKIKWFNYGE